MKVRVLVSIASATWSYAPGQVVEMPDEQARTWVKSGLAEIPRSDGALETATQEAPENAAKRRGRPRK